MAQNISLLGATYLAVPAVELPKDGGGTAMFTDTSPTTATADKMMQGYGAFGADGVWFDGTIIDGDNLGYGVSNLVGSAIVGTSTVG